MVSTIVPGAAGAPGVDPRLHRQPVTPAATDRRQDAAASQGDRVEVSGASLAAARESVRAAVEQLHQALALGREAQAFLVRVQGLVRDGAAQEDLDVALAAFAQRVELAAAQGARLVAGDDLAINAEPGAPPIMAPGVDLRLKMAPRPGDVMLVAAEAAVDDPALPGAVKRSLELVQAAMGRLVEVARSLEAHQGFIGAAERAVASSVRPDLDAEGARLLALQVRQGLEAVGGRSIANVEPQAVLALFRA